MWFDQLIYTHKGVKQFTIKIWLQNIREITSTNSLGIKGGLLELVPHKFPQQKFSKFPGPHCEIWLGYKEKNLRLNVENLFEIILLKIS